MYLGSRFTIGFGFIVIASTYLAGPHSAKALVHLPAPQFLSLPTEIYMASHVPQSSQHPTASAPSGLAHPLLSKKTGSTLFQTSKNRRQKAMKARRRTFASSPSSALAATLLVQAHPQRKAGAVLPKNARRLSPSALKTLDKKSLMGNHHHMTVAQTKKLQTIPRASIVRVHDCLLTATIYTGNWNVECMRSGSTNAGAWDNSGWHITPLASKVVPHGLWAVCTWLNGFGYDELTTTPDLSIDRRLGDITRRKNVFFYHHGYEVSGGMTIITRLGRHCPMYGKSVRKAPAKPKDWSAYLDLI